MGFSLSRNPKCRVFGTYAILGVWREALKTRFSQFVSCSMYNLTKIFKDNTKMLWIIRRQFHSKFGSTYDFTLTCLTSAWIQVTTIKLDLQCSMRFLTNVKSHISIQVLIKRHELEICYRRIEARVPRPPCRCHHHTLLLLQIQVPRKYYWFLIELFP